MERKICRDSIYVGKVVKLIKAYEVDGEMKASAYKHYRTMLFTLNEEKLSEDLLYETPEYPVLNFGNLETIVKEDAVISEKVVVNAFKLDEYLKYFGYSEEFSVSKLKEIRKFFFSGNFGEENCELFGMRELLPEDLTYYNGGIEVTDPAERKRYINRERISRILEQRMFSTSGEDHPFPTNMMEVFDDLGNDSILDIICGCSDRINKFKPAKEEGKIKKKKLV